MQSRPILLVVDDDKIVGRIIQRIGDAVGFETRTYQTAGEFEEAVLACTPASLIIDIVLPDKDGLELLSWLDEQNIRVPVIFISGFSGGYLQAANKLGTLKGVNIAATLKKPFHADDMEIALANILSIELQKMAISTTINSNMDLEAIPPEMSVGHPLMDAHHLKLLNMVRRCHYAVEAEKSTTAALETVAELTDYTLYHFESEEALMEQSGFPQFENHRQVHHLLIKKVSEFATEMANGVSQETQIHFISFLYDWLCNHIMSMDRRYENWVRDIAASD